MSSEFQVNSSFKLFISGKALNTSSEAKHILKEATFEATLIRLVVPDPLEKPAFFFVGSCSP